MKSKTSSFPQYIYFSILLSAGQWFSEKAENHCRSQQLWGKKDGYQ